MQFNLTFLVFTLITTATARAIENTQYAKIAIETRLNEHDLYRRNPGGGGGGGGRGGGGGSRGGGAVCRGQGNKSCETERKHHNILPPRDEPA